MSLEVKHPLKNRGGTWTESGNRRSGGIKLSGENREKELRLKGEGAGKRA